MLVDGLAVAFDDPEGRRRQSLVCMDFATGQVRWRREGLGSGSLTAADGKLVVLSEDGRLLVAPISAERFEPIAETQILRGRCWTAPVIANGLLYCRSHDGELICADLRGH